MHLLCVGLSHRTAPVELRERVAFDADAAAAALRGLRQKYSHAELALLSTCNRTEFYIARPLHGHPRLQEVVEFLASARGVEIDRIADVIYHRDNEHAIRHLMSVAAGLDSMVLGENQILGQVKAAYELAQQAGSIDKVLHRVFQSALATAKRVRSETDIGAGRTSVSSIAVDFAQHLFHSFDDKTVLTIGAGKMTELTLRHFMDLRPGRLLVCNRSAEKAADLAARFGGEPAPFEKLGEHLIDADVVISSTAAHEPIVTEAMFRPLIRQRRFRPLIIIDIAVPRDFEAAVGHLANVYLYDMDDLQRAIDNQRVKRNGSVNACEVLIDAAMAETYAAIQTSDRDELIRRLRDHMQEIGSAEVQRTLNKLRSADPAEHPRILDELSHRMINKILHKPVSELGRGGSTQAAMYATALRRLFDLEAETEDLNPPERDEPTP